MNFKKKDTLRSITLCLRSAMRKLSLRMMRLMTSRSVTSFF